VSRLPAGFDVLDPFIEQWAIEGTANRARLRTTSSDAERRAFYAAGHPLLAKALDHLDTKPLVAFDDADQRLMNLILSLAHVSFAVEIQADAETRHAPLRELMVITRAPADGPAGSGLCS
jgi:hypothetical protein